jgi:hypothetical protein
MGDNAEFKRLNYFTGFFMTAADFTAEQGYFQGKRRLHNRGLHTPGVIRGERQSLKVEAAGGLTVRVLSGAALDGQGNEIYLGEPRTLAIDPGDYTLPRLVYVAIAYHEELTDHVENVEAPQYSGDTRVAETPRVQVTAIAPDNRTWLELARIDLQPGVTAIANPADPDNLKGNEIDRRYVVWAGAVGVVRPEDLLSPDLLARLIQLMERKRRDFAALAGRFPVPSADDVRHAALTVELMARIGCLRPEQLPGVLATIAAIEQDVGQEFGAAHPGLTTSPEYQAYQAAVAALLTALRDGMGLDAVLNRQDAVAAAARELSEIVLQAPVADAGPDQTSTTSGNEGTVTLDASASRAFGGRQIKSYRWDVKTSAQPPVADAGPDRTVTTPDSEATVALDASGSRASGGKEIARYRWDEKGT